MRICSLSWHTVPGNFAVYLIGCITAPFTVAFTRPNSRKYVISYWYLTGIWKLSPPQPYNSASLELSGGDGYDDIRIYPEDADLTTFTYSPLAGTTSVIDPKDQTVFYKYDAFFRLTNTRDNDGNIIAHLDYHYR